MLDRSPVDGAPALPTTHDQAIVCPGRSSGAALLGLLAAFIVIALHMVRTGVDPLVDGVSAYALCSHGGLYRVQVIFTRWSCSPRRRG
jgi:hypothetical protein